jgi:hypothetical protein
MISAYAYDIVKIIKHRVNLNLVIKKIETKFGNLNLKLKKKNAG